LIILKLDFEKSLVYDWTSNNVADYGA
jgi:hypothetical protein